MTDKQIGGAWCKGDWAFLTACGECERCKDTYFWRIVSDATAPPAMTDKQPAAWLYEDGTGIRSYRDANLRMANHGGWTETPLYTRPATAQGDVEALENLLRYHETGGHDGDGSDHAMRLARQALRAMTERDRALREAALRVLAWVDQVAGDNRRPDEAAEELASVEALSTLLASTGDAA